MQKRKHKTYLDKYEMVVLTQPLANSRYIKQIYERTPNNRWFLIWESNSTYHICPYNGVFRKCADCGADEDDFDLSYCEKFYTYVDDKELSARIRDCKRAGLEVRYVKP